MPRNALGRGLGALIREPEPTNQAPAPATDNQSASVTTVGGAAAAPARETVTHGPQEIDIDLVAPSPYQPRTRFREEVMDEFQLTQESVAERTGKDRATVANAIRLLKLEPTIQEWIEEAKLTAGHGRALLAVPDAQLRMRYAQRAARGALTVRQIERLASRRSHGGKAASEINLDANIRSALDELQRHLGTKVLLHQKTKVRPGQLVLEYYDEAQL